jgi:hypothetical protein
MNISGLIFLGVVFLLIYSMSYITRLSKAKKIAHFKENWGKSIEDRYFNFTLISKYFNNRLKHETGYFQAISDKTAEDLNLHAIFKLLDRTTSKIGQQYLYYKLRLVNKNLDKLQDFDRWVEAFSKDEEQRLQCQLTLKRLEKSTSYHFDELIHGSYLPRPAWFPIAYILAAIVLLCVLMAFWNPGFLIYMLPVIIINLVIHLWNKNNISFHVTALTEFSKVYHTGKILSEVPIVKAHLKQVGFIDELSSLQKKMKLVSLSDNAESETSGLVYLMVELLKIAFNIEIIAFYTLIKEIKAKHEALHELFILIGEADAAISIASYRAGSNHFCKPIFGEAKQMNMLKLRHPLVNDCVPNNLQLSEKSLLLTGSNMSGKTTFVRAVGINMLLAQTIYTCTAQHFEAPFSRVYTSITISDDIISEKSYYFEEVATIKAFIDQAQHPEPAIFILDEIFKGTNTVERISGGKAILSYLSKGNHFVFVSTHDIELTALLENEFELYHFSESIERGQLVFDHKIKAGPLTTRNAIKILGMSDYPEEIITEANAIVSSFEVDKV